MPIMVMVVLILVVVAVMTVVVLVVVMVQCILVKNIGCSGFCIPSMFIITYINAVMYRDSRFTQIGIAVTTAL